VQQTKEELDFLDSLVSPYGPVAAVRRMSWRPGVMPRELAVYTTSVGSGAPGMALRGSGVDGLTVGAGRTLANDGLSRLIAIAEGAERYAAGDFLGERRLVSAASELDGPALDLDRVPRCSERELSVPGCPVGPLDPRAPIAWVEGFDLICGGPIWVPAVMACYRLVNTPPPQRFWHKISTGYAIHVDPVEALIGGICEIIERDLIAIMWLQRLSLPVVPSACLSDTARLLLDWSEEHFIDTYLFDGTTDIGVPTVYCLQVAAHDDRARQIVGAATTRSIGTAAEKALMEAISSRPNFHVDKRVKEDFSKFAQVDDGARYMARADMAHAFDFLLDGAATPFAPERTALPEDPKEALSQLLKTLRRKGMQAVVVDRTTRELNDAGLTAVNVVIPDLQPMTLSPLAQYRAHPRLYEAPVLMGYSSHSEEDLNPWPQPFH
jgi:ribosomal protein S12 methylthiotransferase accessory factor